MRILTVANCALDPSLGSGYVMLGYAEGLRARGHEVTTLEPSDYEWFPNMTAAKRLRVIGGYSMSTLRALRAADYDVVEFWGGEAGWVTRRLARRDRARRPLIVARSNGLETHSWETFAKHGIARKSSLAGALLDRLQTPESAFRGADALTMVSHQDLRYALSQGYQPEDRLLALENPLSDEWLDRPFSEDRPRVLGFFGSEIPNKGGEIFVRALPAILGAHPDWKARIVGSRQDVFLNNLPADILNRVERVPFVKNREHVRALYRETAVVAMPSAYESFGLVATEAMSCGCAVAASPSGFAADLESGENILLVAERTVAAWQNALINLLDDDASRLRIARRGHARVQSLRWGPALDRLEEFYERLLSARKSR